MQPNGAPGLFFSKQPDSSWLICMVLVCLKQSYPQVLHVSPATLEARLASRDLKNRIRAIARLAEQGLITYSIFIPSTAMFRDVTLTEACIALLSRVPHGQSRTHSERLEAALTSGNAALQRLVVDELVAEWSGRSSERSDS